MTLERPSMQSQGAIASVSIVLLLALGCGAGDASEAQSEAPDDTVDGVESDGVESEAPSTRLFPQRDGEHVTGGPAKDAACSYLSAARAAALLEVPVEELEPRGECEFRWESETEVGYVSVGRVYVYDNLADSIESFRTATANRGSEETQAEAAAVHEGAAERLGGSARAAREATRDIVAGAADFAQRYEPLEGIGDEAAFAHHDGQVIVRLSNMRFAVTAYRCAREPERPPPTRAQLRDLAALSRQARAHTQQWIADTSEVRRRMAVDLAGQLVGALDAYRASL